MKIYRWIEEALRKTTTKQFALVNACPGAGNSLYIAKGNGSGGFTLSQETGLSGQLHALTSADFNNDGYLDLAGSCNGGPYQIMLLLNDGNGSFTETST